MADLRQCSREFLCEFITLYQGFPCLWRVKSKDYSDRDKKRQAYECLVEKFKEIDVTANRETVVKKINSLRSVYRKELAKINKSHRSGAGEDDIYKPSLWYFELLNFLKDQEAPRQSTNTMGEDEESTDTPEQLEEDNEGHADTRSSQEPATTISEASTPHTIDRPVSRNSSKSQSSTRKRKGVSNDDGTTEVMALVGKKLDLLQADDDFQVFGKHVANKLRNVSCHQNIIAQKLISDILFEAELGTLTRDFQVIDMSTQRQTQMRMPHTQVGHYQSFPPIPQQLQPQTAWSTQEYFQGPTHTQEQTGQTQTQEQNLNSPANYFATFKPN